MTTNEPDKTLQREAILQLVGQYGEQAFAEKRFVPGVTPIPAAGKVIGGKELRYLVDAALDAWLTTGRFNDAFEQRLAEYVGVKHALTANSGSSANLLAFAALTSPELGERAIKPGDEVITVAAGFPTTINPILQHGAVPVFLDISLPTYNLNAALLEEAVTKKTKAIVLAHTLGNPFDVDEVMRVAERHHLWVIEDCCDALGSTYRGKPVGRFGDIGTVSFYPAHHITMGEGGAVLTSSGKLKRLLESFRDWGRDCYCAPGHDNSCGRRYCWKLGGLPQGYDHKYTYSHAGYNLKITDMQAAIGLAQMDRLEAFTEARKRNYQYLKAQLAGLEEHLILPEATPGTDPSWFGFPLTLRPDVRSTRTAVLKALEQHRIGTRLLFGGNLTRQPYMRDRVYRIHGELANTDVVMNRTFWIGVYPKLERAQLDYVIDKLGEALSARPVCGTL